MAEFVLREGRESDHAFVYATWLRSFETSELARARCGTKTDYYAGQHDVVERLLRRSNLVVACTEADEDVILGWVVYEPGVLHYVYVKSPMRRFGVARSLIQASTGDSEVTYTHLAPMSRELARRIPSWWRYDSYKAD